MNMEKGFLSHKVWTVIKISKYTFMNQFKENEKTAKATNLISE